MHDVILMRVGQRIGDPRHDAQCTRQRHQLIGLGIGHQILALEKLHRNVGQVMLLAGVEHGDDVGMIEPPRGFGLAEKTLLDISQFVLVELLRQGHGLDRHHAIDFRIAPHVNHTHGALAELLLDLVAAQHRLLDIAGGIDQAGIAAPPSTATKNHGFRELLGAVQAGFDVTKLRIEIENIAKHRLGLVELSLAFEIERQVVHVLQQLVIQRAFAKLVEGHVELTLALEGQTEHAV